MRVWNNGGGQGRKQQPRSSAGPAAARELAAPRSKPESDSTGTSHQPRAAQGRWRTHCATAFGGESEQTPRRNFTPQTRQKSARKPTREQRRWAVRTPPKRVLTNNRSDSGCREQHRADRSNPGRTTFCAAACLCPDFIKRSGKRGTAGKGVGGRYPRQAGKKFLAALPVGGDPRRGRKGGRAGERHGDG